MVVELAGWSMGVGGGALVLGVALSNYEVLPKQICDPLIGIGGFAFAGGFAVLFALALT